MDVATSRVGRALSRPWGPDPAAALLPSAEWGAQVVRHQNKMRLPCPALYGLVAAEARFLVATRPGGYPHTDDGVEVRRVLHKERSVAIENFYGQFKAIFDVGGPVPTRGRVATARWVLGAVLVDQLTLLDRHHLGLDLRTGLKPFLQAA